MREVRSRKVAVYALKSSYLQKVANMTSVAIVHLKKILNYIPHVTMYTSLTLYLHHALYCIKRVLLVYCSWILEESVTQKEYRYPCSIADTYCSTMHSVYLLAVSSTRIWSAIYRQAYSL